MLTKNRICTVVLGIAATAAMGTAAADEDGDKICAAIARANINAPVNEVYLGVFGRIKSTYKSGGEGEIACHPSAGGACAAYTETNNLLNKTITKNRQTISDPHGPAVVGFSRIGGAPLIYKAKAYGGGQENGIQMNYVLCENGKSIDNKLIQQNKKVLVCRNGGLQSEYGPDDGYPQKKWSGFKGLTSSSEGGTHEYPISFQGLIEKNESNEKPDVSGKNGCERLATNENPPPLLKL